MPAHVLTDTCDAARTTNRQPACGTPSKARQAPLIGGWLCLVRRPRHVPLPAEVSARAHGTAANKRRAEHDGESENRPACELESAFGDVLRASHDAGACVRACVRATRGKRKRRMHTCAFAASGGHGRAKRPIDGIGLRCHRVLRVGRGHSARYPARIRPRHARPARAAQAQQGFAQVLLVEGEPAPARRQCPPVMAPS